MKLARIIFVACLTLVPALGWSQDFERSGGESRKVVRGSLFQDQEITPLPENSNEPSAPPGASFFSVAPIQPRKFKKHDIITIVISEMSDASTSGSGKSSKKQDFDLALEQFLELNAYNNGWMGIGKASNPNKLPEIKFKYNNDRANDATQSRQDKFTARISATVIDVKPNGTMLIEAVKNIKMDKEVQRFRLSGVCRAEDITPDNTVLSTQMADLNLLKETSGEVREGTRRGWLNTIIDTVNPF